MLYRNNWSAWCCPSVDDDDYHYGPRTKRPLLFTARERSGGSRNERRVEGEREISGGELGNGVGGRCLKESFIDSGIASKRILIEPITNAEGAMTLSQDDYVGGELVVGEDLEDTLRRESATFSLFKAGPQQLYVRAVVKAFQTHFANDEELRPIWESLTWLDWTQIIYKVSNYREKRLKNKKFTQPKPVGELRAKDVQDWLFFAEAAYLEDDRLLRTLLKERDHDLISFRARAGLFEPAFFLSMLATPNTQEIVLGIKGTSSLADWLTNLWIKKADLTIDGLDNTKIDLGVHAGCMHAAKCILGEIGPLLERAFFKIGFKLTIVGHSLGAGVATVLALMLREERGYKNVNCYAFAPPPAVSRHLAELGQSYIYSVVNSDDAIPRTSVKQLKTLCAGVKRLKDIRATVNRDWNKVEQILDLRDWDDLENSFAMDWKETKFETFIAGRVLYLFQGYCNEVRFDCPALRIPIVSSHMMLDHSLTEYEKALGVEKVV